MPFSETRHGEGPAQTTITRRQWTYIFEHWIKKAVETYPHTPYVCKRSAAAPGNFIKGIIADLADADLVIADLTGGKRNVYYELGIRHALRTGTIIITQHLSALPSDLAGYYAFEYGYNERDYEYEPLYAQFEQELHEKIRALEETQNLSDSPVSDFLGLRHELLRRQADEEAAALRWLLSNLKGAIIKNCEICEDLTAMAQAIRSEEPVPELRHLPFVDLFHVDVLYERLLTTGWSPFLTESLQHLVNLISGVRENILLVQRLWEKVDANSSGGPDLMDALLAVSRAVTDHKNVFEQKWDGLLETLTDMKIVQVPSRSRRRARPRKQQKKGKRRL
jgi:hypothetical protein